MIAQESLRRSPMFLGLSEAALARIAAMGQERTYGPGQYIFREGEASTELYVLRDGRVALEMSLQIGRADVSGRKAFIAVMGPSDCFGWSALVPPHHFTMSAVAVQQSTVLAIDGPALQALIADEPQVGVLLLDRLNQVISNRLTEARAKFCTIIALISHELKAPLAAVESYLQVLLGGYAGDLAAQQQEMISRCSVRVGELLELIDTLLRVSRIETGDLTPEIAPAPLDTVIAGALENVSPAARERGVELLVELPHGLAPLPMSRLRIQEAITNLLDNAVKFTPQGGHVTAVVTEREDHVEVQIRDSGIGIPPEELPRIFDEFYRGRNARAHGLGLGLSLVKKIVGAHGGQIWAASPPAGSETGSSFHFTLPKKHSPTDTARPLTEPHMEAA